jgi:hypothetical protein
MEGALRAGVLVPVVVEPPAVVVLALILALVELGEGATASVAARSTLPLHPMAQRVPPSYPFASWQVVLRPG